MPARSAVLPQLWRQPHAVERVSLVALGAALPPRLPRGVDPGQLASGLTLTLAIWLAAVPLLGAGPTWIKSCFARLARATKRGKPFEYTALDGTPLLLGAVPRSEAHLQALHDAGVRAVVTLNQGWEPQAPASAFRTAGLEQLRLPTPDFAAPSQRDIRRAVDFIGRHVEAGHHVYVHCNGGKGRSAVCTLAYLVAQGMSAREAYDFVAAQRRITALPRRLLGFRRPQWRALLRFESTRP